MCKLTLNSSAINITFELSFIKKKDKKIREHIHKSFKQIHLIYTNQCQNLSVDEAY